MLKAFNFFLCLPMRWDDESEMWFKTFCILIRSQAFVSDWILRLVSAKYKVTHCIMLTVAKSTGLLESSAAEAALWQFGIRLQWLACWKDLAGRLELCQLRPQGNWQTRFCIKGTHTHARAFNGALSGTTQVSQYHKGKTNLDFTGARDSEWQWHQLGHMQVCTSTTPAPHHSVFYRPDALPAAQPTASKHWRYIGRFIILMWCD